MNLRLLCAVVFGLAPFGPATAQDEAGLPPAVVLALNVLSETHARTATGLVISDRGQVLLPASFVGRGDDIRVLVDGTRLESDGFETRTEARSAATGLAVVGTTGLRRTPFALAMDDPADGAQLTFHAFPSAGALAEGAAPLREGVRVAYRDGQPGIDPASALPGVNGALVDRCGLLAGVVFSADDTMRPGDSGRIMWPQELSAALREFGVDTAPRHCGGTQAAPAAQTPAQSSRSPAAQILDPGSLLPSKPDLDVSGARANSPQAQPEPNDSPSPTVSTGNAPAADPTQRGEPGTGQDDAPPRLAEAGQSATQRTGAFWPWLLVPLFAVAGWWLGRRRSARNEPGHVDRGAAIAAESSWSPATEAASTAGKFTNLAFRIEAPGAEPREAECRFDPAHNKLLIGRGDVDLALDRGAGSQVHGVIRAVDGLLLYGDAGSPDGSWVDGMACLPGERFALVEGAVLSLGAFRLTLTAVRLETRTS